MFAKLTKLSAKYIVAWVVSHKTYGNAYKTKKVRNYKTKSGMLKAVNRAIAECTEDGVSIFKIVGRVRNKFDLVVFLNEESKYE